MYLKKYRIEQFLQETPKFFLIAELLPMKEAKFVALAQNLNKIGFEIKMFNAKALYLALRFLKQGTTSNGESDGKKFKGNFVFIIPLTSSSISALSEKLPELTELVPLFWYCEGAFYHGRSFSSPSLDIYNTLKFPTYRLIQILTKIKDKEA